MRNLAGPWSEEKDYAIELELRAAGIPAIVAKEPNGREVNAKVTGRLGKIEFVRGWYYWIVSGLVPIAMAQEMYADECGKRDVRVAGHCGRPPPDQWARTHATADGFAVCVDSYHIDSQEGLNLFALMAHKHGIVERPIVSKGWTVEATEGILREMDDVKVKSTIGAIIARRAPFGEFNMDDPRIVDLVRRCREAHPANEEMAQ